MHLLAWSCTVRCAVSCVPEPARVQGKPGLQACTNPDPDTRAKIWEIVKSKAAERARNKVLKQERQERQEKGMMDSGCFGGAGHAPTSGGLDTPRTSSEVIMDARLAGVPTGGGVPGARDFLGAEISEGASAKAKSKQAGRAGAGSRPAQQQGRQKPHGEYTYARYAVSTACSSLLHGLWA